MSVGGRQVVAPSRCTVTSRPGELGREKRLQQDSEAESTGEIRGSDRSQVRGKKRDPGTVLTGGEGEV